MDLSLGQLRHAQNRVYGCRTLFVKGDVTESPLPDGSFDKVVVSHAIHEMPRVLRQRTLEEANRVLKPSGEVIVLELDNPPNFLLRIFMAFWFFYWLPGNVETPTRRDMMRCGLSAEVMHAGFVDVEKHSVCRGVFQTVIGTK